MSNDESNPIHQFRQDAQHVKVARSAAGRSAADDVIEQVGDFAPPKRQAKNACPLCGSVDFRTSRPLGSAPRHKCRECGHKWMGGPRSPSKLVLAKTGPTQTSVSGPYYRGSASRPKQDRHQPTARRKAKSLAHLKEKLK